MTKPPTPEQIAEHNAGAEVQFGRDLAKLIRASGVEEPQLVAIVLCQVLIQLIMATDEITFAEAGKIAVGLLKTVIKKVKYCVKPNNELIDLKTGKEISPEGFKQ